MKVGRKPTGSHIDSYDQREGRDNQFAPWEGPKARKGKDEAGADTNEQT